MAARRPSAADRSCEREQQHAGAPLHRDIGHVVAQRLRQLPANQGVDRIDPLLLPVSEGEDLARQGAGWHGRSRGHRTQGQALPARHDGGTGAARPDRLRRGACRSGPRTTSVYRADGIADPALRALYVSIYLSTGGSPLGGVDRMRGQRGGERETSRTALEELIVLALKAFPHAVLPNKLIRDIDSLAKSAGLDLPLTEEMAADIFMGEFSPKHAAAARLARQLIGGTLYARYYDIADDPSQASEGFAAVCFARAGPRNPGRGVAYKGCVIEWA
jgi:hypothetical protein